MENKNSILLDYYDGAYGPTIRIDVQSIETLVRIKNLFLQLAESRGYPVNLAEINNVKAIRLNQLILSWVPDDQHAKKKLTLASNSMTGAVFEWTMSSDSWKRAAGLVDGLLERGSSGHQYLTQEGVDDAIVELAFME